MSYPKIVKEAALEKMFHTDLSLRHISDELGIPRATLHCWKKQYASIINDSDAIATPGKTGVGKNRGRNTVSSNIRTNCDLDPNAPMPQCQ